MKLLLESWKSYINEEEQKDYEKSHFGSNLNELGNKLYQAYLEFKDYYDFSEIIEHIGVQAVKFAGEGSFRAVFQYGDNLVIKLAKINSAKIMNKQDAQLGKSGIHSILFPKVYATGKDYDWIVMEKCKPILTVHQFMQFFENKFFDEFIGESTASVSKKYVLFQRMLEYQVNLIKKDDEAAKFVLHRTSNIDIDWSYAKRILKTATIDEQQFFKKILDGYPKTFQHLANAIAELGIDILEIRPHNVGVAPDGRFVIIDSSIQESIVSANEDDFKQYPYLSL